MVCSMTGFAGKRLALVDGVLAVEIKTLNHRALDIHCRLPDSLFCLEIPLRRLVKTYLNRGRVDVKVVFESGGAHKVELNKPVYDSYIDILSALPAPSSKTYDSVALLGLPGILAVPETVFDEEAFWPLLEEVLTEVVADRRREGAVLWRDLTSKTKSVIELVGELEHLAQEQQRAVGEKFQQRLAQLGGVDDNRIIAEAALLADKSDINEELVRLKAHLQEFQSCCQRSEPIGRRLEFLGQEMLREANTIGAKSAVYTVSKLAVEIKSQLEKVREQLQNIE